MKGLILSILIATASIYNLFWSDYLESRPRNCEVVQTYSGLSTGRYSHTEFIFVLRTEDNQLFDLRVSAATFSQHTTGDRIVFDLRQMDIRQTVFDNLIMFISIFGAVCGIFGICLSCYTLRCKTRGENA